MLYAFFGADGKPDRDTMRQQINRCIASGAQGIAILGLITEVSALTPGERKQLISWCAEDLDSRAPLAVTIAGRTAQEQIDLARYAIEHGADWLILQPPIGDKPDSQTLLRFFDRVMETISLPAGIQNVPEILGVGLDCDEVVQLHRQQAHFTVMKAEGPVSVVKPYIDALQGEVAVFNGRGGLELTDNLRAGCSGMIPAPDCADIQIELYQAELNGDKIRANELYTRILPYVVFAMQTIEFHIVYGKKMFAKRAGIDTADHRLDNFREEAFFSRRASDWAEAFGPYPGS